MTDSADANGAMNRLKRSRILHVGSLMATASFTLAACGSPPERVASAPEGEWSAPVTQTAQTDTAFRSVEECTASGAATASECEAAYAAAAKDAPKFTSQQECEQNWGEGQCEQRKEANGSSVFMPMMMGFLLGRMLTGGGRAAPAGLFGNNGSPRTATGNMPNRPMTTPAQGNTRADTRTVTRGGFGASSSRSYGG